MKTVYIYDPTVGDEQSKVRGIGRYFQTLQEALDTHPEQKPSALPRVDGVSSEATDIYYKFTSDIKLIRKDSIYINPFFNLLQPPPFRGKRAQKQIAIIHDMIPQKYPKQFPVGLRGWWQQMRNKQALAHYDLIVTDSEVSKADIIHILKIPPERVQVIYPTVPHIFTPHLDTDDESYGHHHPFHTVSDQSVPEFTTFSLDKISNNPQIQQLTNFILYVGDATWNKNLPTLAQSIIMANIPCVFAGKVFGEPQTRQASEKPHPWQKPLRDFIRIAQKNPLFIFPGYVSDVELLLLYKKARINVLISHDEGFGLSFIEAGYMSTPSILADRPIFHETAKDAAVFVNPLDPKDIAQHISRLYYDAVFHKKMSIRAFDRAQEFNTSRFKQEWQTLLHTI